VIQKVEKWRVQELGQALNQLALLLRRGENTEWANVFSHFGHEAQNITTHENFDLDVLKRLAQNIVNCFDGISSLRKLVLNHENPRQMETLNQKFREAIQLLFEILASIEEKWTEPIN